MKCPKCKKGKMVYYPSNYYANCDRCDYRNGTHRFIRRLFSEKKEHKP